jgi:hypothetical protein
MGFSKGTEAQASLDGNGAFPLYTGIAPVSIVAVNPTAEQLSAIYGRKVEKIADYTGKNNDGIQYSRIDFIVKVSDALQKQEKIEKPVFGKLTFFITAGVMKNKDETKVKVINNYGQTQWVTAEILQKMGYPITNDGREMTDFILPYKPCANGEEELIHFLKAYLNIPNFREMVDGVMTVKPADKLSDCMAGFSIDEIKQILNGNINPVKVVTTLQPDNQVKVLFTVKITADNKKYQHVYNRFFAKAKDFGAKERFEKHINDNQQSVTGLDFNYAFSEWKESPTDLSAGTNTVDEIFSQVF